MRFRIYLTNDRHLTGIITAAKDGYLYVEGPKEIYPIPWRKVAHIVRWETP